MQERKSNPSIPTGLSQDLQLITIRTIGAQSFCQSTSIKLFLKGEVK